MQNGTRRIAWYANSAILFATALACFAFAGGYVSAATPLINPYLGKWQVADGQETVEFFRNGTVDVVDRGKLVVEGTYEILENGEVSVDFRGLGPFALPVSGKLSALGRELTLTLSNGSSGRYIRM